MENPGADDPCGQVDLSLEAKIGLTPLPKIKMTLRTEVPPQKKVGHKTFGALQNSSWVRNKLFSWFESTLAAGVIRAWFFQFMMLRDLQFNNPLGL